MKRAGVLRFPGTNCDRDVFKALEAVGFQAHWCWHKDSFEPGAFDFYVLPGGFSYGDYLRPGALAARSQAVASLIQAARQGRPVLGICNGFQVLCEAGLLPGALLANESGRFVEGFTTLRWELRGKLWGLEPFAQTLKLPVAHADGRYYVEPEELEELKERDQIWLTYQENINGSLENVAGVLSKERNVAGLMPHPERAMARYLGGEDGRKFLEGVFRVLG